MRDALLRRKKDELMTPVVRQLFGSIHPNWVSVIAMVVGLTAVAAVLNHAYLLGLALWLFNRILDGLDGVVARIHGKQSDFGGYLDLFLDFIVYLAVPIGFLWALPELPNLWAGIALLAIYVLNLLSWSMLSALLEKRQSSASARLTSLEMPTGLIEGAETILFYSLFFLLPAYIAWLFGIMALLVLTTALQRVIWAYHHLD